MANYYVDISTSNPGLYHTGTKRDPFSYAQFITHIGSNSNNNYYIRGIKDDSSTSLNITTSNNTWNAWDLGDHGPWRLKLNSFQTTDTSGSINDGIIETGYFSILCETRDMYLYDTGSSTSTFSGVSVYNSTLSKAAGSLNITNSVSFNSVALKLGVAITINAGATLTVDSNCETDRSSGTFYTGTGTLVDNGITYGVTYSADPTYTSTDLTEFALGSSTGVGTTSIWAVEPDDYYVNITEDSTGDPGHYADAPMGWNDFTSFFSSYLATEKTYKLWGDRSLTSDVYLYSGLNNSSNTFESYKPEDYGPFKITSTSRLWFGNGLSTVNISGGSISAYELQMWLEQSDTGTLSVSTSHLEASLIFINLFGTGTAEFKGCTLISQSYITLDAITGSRTASIENSLIDTPYIRKDASGTLAVTITNCSMSAASETVFNGNSGTDNPVNSLSVTGSEFGWTPPVWPDYNASRFLFYYSKILENVGISGTGTYTGYDTGLWGSPRTGIGAVAYERVLYFDIDTDNDSSDSNGFDSDQPANFYELLTQIRTDRGIKCKVRGARDSEYTHKDVFAYPRPELWEYNYVSESLQYYVYNEYDLNEVDRSLDYNSPNANTFMREGIGGEFDIIVDANLSGTTNSLGFLLSDPNIAPGSIYPYVMVTIDGTNATATYLNSVGASTVNNSALTADRALVRLRRVSSGASYTYYFEYHENLRASYNTSGWTQIWSTTLATSSLSESNLELYLERGSAGTSFHGIEIQGDEGLEIPTPFVTVGNEYVGNIIEAWNLDNYGPWRLKTYQICGNFTSFNDCILESTATDTSDASRFCGSTLSQILHTNVNFKLASSGMTLSSEGDINPKGVTIVSEGDITVQDLRPNYEVEEQTLNRSFFDDFNTDTWDSFWNSDVQTYFKLDPDNSRIEAQSDAVNEVYFLTLGTSVDWVYESQMFIRDTINKSHGFRVKVDGSSSDYVFKWYDGELYTEGPTVARRDIELANDATTILQIKITYVASSNLMTWYFRFSPESSWIQLTQATVAATSSIQFGLDVGYDATLNEGNGYDWVYLQESGTTLSNEGFPFETNFTDSSLDAPSIDEGTLSASKINSNYTAYSDSSTPSKGTHTNSLVNWTAPVQPAWNAGYISSTTIPTPDSWSFLTLRGNIPIAFGTGSYLDYPEGLFGFERFSIGAYYFPPDVLSFNASPNPGYTNENITFTPENDSTATAWSWDFNSDGIVDSTDRIATHAYNFDSILDRFYLVTLTTSGPLSETVTGIVGVRNRLSFDVYSEPGLAVGFPASETVNLGYTAASRLLDISTIEWTIERDGSPYTAINGVTGISLNYTDGGIYIAEMRASDRGVSGMPGNEQEAVESTTFIVLNFSIDVNPNKAEVGDTISYQVTGGISGHTFRWRFGDSSFADGDSVTHQYSTGGIYDITLIVDRGTPEEQTFTYNASDVNLSELRVFISDLTVGFTGNPHDGFPTLSVKFEDLSNSALGLTKWEWFFTGPPDGIPDAEGVTGPIFNYTEESTYFPYLTVTDLGGFQGTATGMIDVYSTTLNIKVYEGSTLVPEPVSKQLPVTLSFVPDVEGEEDVTNWKWELIYDDSVYGELILSDQETAAKSNFNYSFSVPAEYKIRLTITDNNSNTFTHTEVITITENIAISASPSSGDYPLAVNFSISNVASSDPNRIANQWDFTNDGTYDTGAVSTSYTYTTANTYTCKLRLAWKLEDKYTPSKSDEIELIKTTTINVTFPTFSLSLTLNPDKGRKPLSVLMQGNSNTPVNTWNWTVDGTVLAETTQQVTYVFNQEGTYPIKLTASDIYGQGPITVEGVVYVSADLSTVNIANESNTVMPHQGSSEVTTQGYGVGFRIPLNTDEIKSSGFTSDDGIRIIFD